MQRAGEANRGVAQVQCHALRVEDASLKDQLGLSHAEESRMGQEIAGFRTRLMAEEAKTNLVELCRLRASQYLANDIVRLKELLADSESQPVDLT